MRVFDQSSAQCHIYTFKEGLFSGLGHDLCIRPASFVIEISDNAGSIKARVDAGSVHVGCAIIKGNERPDILTDHDKEEIDQNIFRDVLRAATYGDILLRSTAVSRDDSGYRVSAELTLHGVTREIAFTIAHSGAFYTSEIWVHLPDYGIKPFSAPLGIIRIKPDILVKIMVPSAPFEQAAGGDDDGGEGEPSASGAIGNGTVSIPVDGVLDLHAFNPKEVRELLPDYIAECRKRGIFEIRVIHGKGAGILRTLVQSILAKSPEVERFSQASEDAGGWGATIVKLKK